MRLILASASPRRRELIRLITDDFLCHPSEIEENVPPGMDPRQVPAFLALCKAKHVARQFPDAAVLGCDTVVLLDGAILGKPKSRAEATMMLRSLSGRTHEVITGCAIVSQKRETVFAVETSVTFYHLTNQQIEAYVASGEADDKAGAYGIQGKGALFVKEIRGDFYNVVGLPIAELSRRLKETMTEL